MTRFAGIFLAQIPIVGQTSGGKVDQLGRYFDDATSERLSNWLQG
jgi:uracil-DNA glycosylase